MEVLTLMLAALMPVIVTGATSQIKKLKSIELSNLRVLWIRAVVAVLAIAASTLTLMVDGGEFDVSLVEAAIYAIFNAGVATWLYQKNK